MRDVFTGFLIMRLIALLALLTLGSVALGISSLARGSDAVGVVLLVTAGLLAAATAWLLTQRTTGRSR